MWLWEVWDSRGAQPSWTQLQRRLQHSHRSGTFCYPPQESELWKWLRGNSDCMLLAFLCFLAPFPLTTCDVSHVCPLFLALEKCHLGLNRPSSCRLWQSARLKGHAPIGIGSPGCAVSGCFWLRSSPRYVISILKTGKTASTPSSALFFFPTLTSPQDLRAWVFLKTLVGVYV